MGLFNAVPVIIPKLHAQDLSFENLLSQEFGELVPVCVKEIYPRDTVKCNTEAVVKLAPMLAPVFSRIDLYIHYFFVPSRLLQSDWEDFITTGTDGTKVLLTPPVMSTASIYSTKEDGTSSPDNGVHDGDLRDFMGYPSETLANVSAIQTLAAHQWNVLPFLAYQKIYSDWFRDELLETFEFEPMPGGTLSSANRLIAMRKRFRSWRKDYFTSARPDAQLGAPVLIPGGGRLAANGNIILGTSNSLRNATNILNLEGNADVYAGGYKSALNYRDSNGAMVNAKVNYVDGIKIDGIDINVNDLRRAIRLQMWQEKNMRGGNRYIENVFQHFGAKSSDARLQRSQLLGGRKIPVMISDVVQTSTQVDANNNPTPQGHLAGKGTAAAVSQTIKFRSEEHGYFICIASIMPHASYMQGLERMYWKTSYLDYAWPLFGNLGEQEIKKGEIFLVHQDFNDDFGYTPRYADLKMSLNQVHGAFRSSQAYWHNARIFSSMPSLNDYFTRLYNPAGGDSNTQPQNRIFSYLPTGYGHFYCHFYHNIKMLRPFSKFGTPSI